jgi:hypothetical protein
MRSFSLRPQGRLETHRARRLLASALPWRCFPAVRRELQHPRRTADPSVPPFAKNIRRRRPRPPCRERICLRVFMREKTHRRGRARGLNVGVRIFDFQNPPHMASRELLIPRIAAAGTSFSPLPCQAWHGFMVANAHPVEVEKVPTGIRAHPPPGPPQLCRRRAPVHACKMRIAFYPSRR